MVKSYLRYSPTSTLGVIASTTANVLCIVPASTSKSSRNLPTLAVVPALESIKVWNVKTSTLLTTLYDSPSTAEVTVLTQNPVRHELIAAGYQDGTVRIWRLNEQWNQGELVVTFNGHKSAVTQLCFDSQGNRLASGSRDTDVVLWDIVSEEGIARLRSHQDQITGLQFLNPSNAADDETRTTGDYLLSAGKDGLIKLWDLSTNFCTETHLAHRGETWALAVSPTQEVVVTAGPDGELKFWSVVLPASTDMDVEGAKLLSQRGSISRANRDRPLSLKFHPSAGYLVVHSSNRNIEVFRIRTAEEIKKLLSRKRKRKSSKKDAANGGDHDEVDEDNIANEIVAYTTIRATAKVTSVDWDSHVSSSSFQLLVSLDTNAVVLYSISQPPTKTKSKSTVEPEATLTSSILLPGHRSEIRTLAISSDDEMLLSAGHSDAKAWNVRTGNVIRSWECGFALCSAFLPGDKIVVLGTKAGKLEVYDLPSSSLVDTIDAHDGHVWSLQISPDKKGIVTGSADKTVKFWNVNVVMEDVPGSDTVAAKLRLQHTRTLKLTEDVLAVRYTPDQKLVAVALLDQTIKIFFANTLKHHLTLYGHASAILSISISLDSKLLLSTSSDRTCKIWGLDFGDCHRSITAHRPEPVLGGMFELGKDERDWHNFWTAGKDGVVKYWDGDTWENILTLKGHHREVWAMIQNSRGDWVASAGRDKSIRIWSRTEEQVFLEEEREKEVEELYEEGLVEGLERSRLDENGEGEGMEVTQAGKQTIETLNAGERIVEALEMGRDDRTLMEEFERQLKLRPKSVPPTRNPIFMALGGVSAEKYVLSVVEKVKPANLQDALLVLPFEHVEILISFITIWAQKGWNIKLTTQLLTSLIRIHHAQIVSSKALRPVLDQLRTSLRKSLSRERELTGWNTAGLGYIKRELIENGVVGFEAEEIPPEKGAKKRAFPAIA